MNQFFGMILRRNEIETEAGWDFLRYESVNNAENNTMWPKVDDRVVRCLSISILGVSRSYSAA